MPATQPARRGSNTPPSPRTLFRVRRAASVEAGGSSRLVRGLADSGAGRATVGFGARPKLDPPPHAVFIRQIFRPEAPGQISLFRLDHFLLDDEQQRKQQA